MSVQQVYFRRDKFIFQTRTKTMNKKEIENEVLAENRQKTTMN